MSEKNKKVMNIVNRIAACGTDIIYYGLIFGVLLVVFGLVILFLSLPIALLLLVIVLLIWIVINTSKSSGKGKDS